MTVLNGTSQGLIARRCETLVPGVVITEYDDGTPGNVCVHGSTTLVELRWSLLSEEWIATVMGSDDDIVCEELSDVVQVLWSTFGSLCYPRVLWEVLDADAAGSDPTVWTMAVHVLGHPKGGIDISEEARSGRQAARMCLGATILSHHLDFPMDLVCEAVAMATSPHQMHESWHRPAIGSTDRERTYP